MGGRGEMPKERLSKKKTHGSHHQRLFEENVRKTNQNCPTNTSIFPQFGASKDEENIPMGS